MDWDKLVDLVELEDLRKSVEIKELVELEDLKKWE